MDRAITGFHQDAADDWVAELCCGHDQHVRHHPPWTNRPWVNTARARNEYLGQLLFCKKCQRAEPRDRD